MSFNAAFLEGTPLIQVRNLVKTFGDRKVLADVNLDVFEGDIKVVMGPSGCGKSTLLRCLNRLVEPTSGTIYLRNTNICDLEIRALRQSIAFVFQQYALYRHLTVLNNVTLGLRKLRGMSRVAAEEKALFELNRLDMGAHRDKYPSEISGGERQRVAIARALAMDPVIIVFDEPTSALDPVMSREVGDLIKKLSAENVTILCVTHDLLLAENISDRVSFLHQGIIYYEDTIDQLSKNHADLRVRSFFSGKAIL